MADTTVGGLFDWVRETASQVKDGYLDILRVENEIDSSNALNANAYAQDERLTNYAPASNVTPYLSQTLTSNSLLIPALIVAGGLVLVAVLK